MKRSALALAVWLWSSLAALAGVTCTVPFNLQNNTTADATQVMANYNALITCLGNAAAAGANNDITSLLGLTTPIGPTVGGSSTYIGGTSTGSANAQVVATTAPTGFTLTQGYTVIFKAGFTNTTATTLNVNAQGATNVFKATAAGPAALTGGEIFSGQLIIATYDGTEFLISPFPLAGWGLLSGAGGIQMSTANPPLGFDACSNLSITASVTASTLVLTFNGNNGSAPSATNPILCSFRDATIANGDPVWATATAALTINTNAAGATLATTNNVPFRFWIVLFNNSSTLVPAIINASTSTPNTQIFSLSESVPQSSTAISAAATSAGVYYTPNGTTVSSKSFRIVGYLEYSSGLATAGTYSSVPTKVQLFGPGTKKPGDVVQHVRTQLATVATGSTQTPYDNTVPQNSEGVLFMTQAITPVSPINYLAVSSRASLSASGAGVATMALHRDGGAALAASNYNYAATDQAAFLGIEYLALANVATSTSFTIRGGASSVGTTTFNGVSGAGIYGGVSNSYISINEIMN